MGDSEQSQGLAFHVRGKRIAVEGVAQSAEDVDEAVQFLTIMKNLLWGESNPPETKPVSGDTALAARIVDLEAENNSLRKSLAKSNADCPYCGLSAAEMSKCAHGFPGCGRADDMMSDN